MRANLHGRAFVEMYIGDVPSCFLCFAKHLFSTFEQHRRERSHVKKSNMANCHKATVYGAGGDNIRRYFLVALIVDQALIVGVPSRKRSKWKTLISDSRLHWP